MISRKPRKGEKKRGADPGEDNRPQSQKFIDTARELGVDEKDDPLDRILKRIVKPAASVAGRSEDVEDEVEAAKKPDAGNDS